MARPGDHRVQATHRAGCSLEGQLVPHSDPLPTACWEDRGCDLLLAGQAGWAGEGKCSEHKGRSAAGSGRDESALIVWAWGLGRQGWAETAAGSHSSSGACTTLGLGAPHLTEASLQPWARAVSPTLQMRKLRPGVVMRNPGSPTPGAELPPK